MDKDTGIYTLYEIVLFWQNFALKLNECLIYYYRNSVKEEILVFLINQSHVLFTNHYIFAINCLH